LLTSEINSLGKLSVARRSDLRWIAQATFMCGSDYVPLAAKGRTTLAAVIYNALHRLISTEIPMPTESSPTELQRDAGSYRVSLAREKSSQDDEVSLLDLLLTLATWKRTILWTTFTFMFAAIVVSLILPQRFTATVTLLPPEQKSSMSAALEAQLGTMGGVASLAGGSLGLKNPNEMFVAMLRSRTVEDEMVRRFQLQTEYRRRLTSDARKEFENHASVAGDGKDGLIHISVDDRDPNRAAELANGYVEAFRNLSEHIAVTEASQRRLFFENQLEKAKDNLADAEVALQETEQKTGLIQLDSQARALIESAAALRAQVGAKEMQIQGMETYATGENAALMQARSELQSLQGQLAKLGGTVGDPAGDIIVPKGEVTQASVEYARKVRDVKYYETIFDILAKQFEIAKLDEAKEGALIQVVDAAVPPEKRSFPKRSLIVICATLAGLFIGSLISMTRSGFERAMQKPETAVKLRLLRRALSLRRSSIPNIGL
jgi:uncharacterized protein involved in exopolysaccharide biosynthesis